MIALPIYVVLVVVVLVAIVFLARFGLRQDRAARRVSPKPGASAALPVIALVAAFLLPPLGIALGHLALYRITIGAATGRRVADWALIVGYGLLVVELITLMVLAGTFSWF